MKEFFNLRAYYGANQLCHLCRAKKTGPGSFGVDLTKQYQRRSKQEIVHNCMATLKNPLCLLPWFDGRWQLKACSMHVVNLGVLQVHNGSCLQLLIQQNFFGSLDEPEALHEASLRFKRFAAASGMQHSVGIITTGMMHDGTAGAFPCLTLKAYNGRIFLSFLHVCLRALGSAPGATREVQLAAMATQSLVLWFQLQESSNKRFMDNATARQLLDATDSYLRLTAGLARVALQTSTLRWKILPKHHAPKQAFGTDVADCFSILLITI